MGGDSGQDGSSYPLIGLLDWMDAPRAGHGFHFADDAGGWSLVDFPRLAQLVTVAAEQIATTASARRGVVSIQLPTGPEFVAAFLGALYAGYTPSPLPPPTFMRSEDEYVNQLADVLRVADPVLVLCDSSSLAPVSVAARRVSLPLEPHELTLSDAQSSFARCPPADLALLQFTSGSSGRPRGVEITWANLECNIRMIRHWLGTHRDDDTVSWLPLYHDMGLIGCMLTPIINESSVWVFRPDQFVMNPFRWIECLGTRPVQIAVSPSFGFAHAAKHVRPAQLEGLDFSPWRIAICGAERLDPEALRRFSDLLGPYGFRPETFLPAYGLAEATLAVTGVRVPAVPRAVLPAWDGLRLGAPVAVEAEAPITDADRIGAGAGWLISCGPPLRGTEIEILDEDGQDLGEGHTGEIGVKAASVARGYQGGDDVGSTSFSPAVLRTGDAGFLHRGELVVIGRIGDALKTRGRAIFVEDLEVKVCAEVGLPKGRVVVLAGVHTGVEAVVAIVEGELEEKAELVAALLARELGPTGGVSVLCGPRGTILRTSSGKPRRRVLWGRFLDGSLETTVAYERGAGVSSES